jgi:lipopolysaccharide export LptBFGC system permease protein LptF
VGWLACIIMAFAAGNRRSFARATLVFLIIGLILAVALYFLFGWVWDAAQEYIRQYISEATGGQITDFNELGDLLDIFKGLDGLEIPSIPAQ